MSQELFQLCGSYYMKRPAWKAVYESLLRLADNLRRYGTYLKQQTVANQTTHAAKVLRADVDEWEVYAASIFIDSPTKRARYNPLHVAVLHAQPYEPIFVNEFAPTDRRRRNEYVNELVFPCKTIRYSYTGQQSHLHFVWKINTTDSETQIQQNNNCKENLEKEFPAYHSRAMKRDFCILVTENVQHFGRATGIKSGILREAYRCLTGDKSAPNSLSEAEVDERIRKVLDDEDPTLAWDLRVTNSGRPEQYLDFLSRCQDYVKSKN